MKKYILIIISLFSTCFHCSSQTFVVDTIIYKGDPANRINLLVMGDGYTSGQMSQFRNDVLTMANYLFNTSPYSQYKDFFNVFGIEVISNQSGSDHSGVSSDNACGSQPVSSMDTYLETGFDQGGSGGGVHRCLYSDQAGLIYSIANTNFPQYDYINVIVNTSYYGGCAGGIAYTSLNSSSNEIFVHELGHLFGDLADEYDYGGTSCNAGTAQDINVSQQTDTSLLVWKKWLTNAPIPTTNGTNCTKIGLYQGANYCATNWYRPKCNCKMNALNQAFCEICKEQLIYKISTMVNYIDSYSPSSLSPAVCRNTPQLFSATVLNSLTNTVRIQWFVDNSLVASNTSSYNFDPTGYADGSHQIKVVTYDTTALAKKTLTTHQLTWNITLSPLLSSSTSQTNVTCNGGTNGTATVTASGGISPYTYSWSTGATTTSVSNLAAATYTVTVTASAGLTTVASTPLCTPATSGYCCGMGIFNVTFNTINKTSSNGNEGYRNFDTVRTNVDRGQTYSLSVQTGSGYEEYTKAWIDYNNNGIFENSELVSGSQNTLPNRLHTANVTIPANATMAALRMRVGSDYALNSTPQSCYSVVYGQFEDYTVFVRGLTGCSKSTPVNITQPGPVTATITPGGATSFCQGSSVALTSSVANSYVWSTGATTQSITVSAAGNYSVTVKDANNCSGTSAATPVTVNTQPTATITPSGPTTFCTGGQVTLTVNSATSYLWNTGATTQSIVVSNAGSYSVTVTSGIGCSATSTPTTITVLPSTAATITAGGATTFCQGDSVLLSANSGSSYLWSTAKTTQSIVVKASGNYSVSVTNACGTTNSTLTSVIVNSVPTVVANASATALCAGATTTLTGSGASTYTWSNGVTNGVAFAPGATTTYTVTGTDVNSCKNTGTKTITVNNLPTVLANASVAALCNGASTILTGSGASTYSWSNGVTNGVAFNPSATITYTVTGTDNNNCQNTATKTINVNPLPSVIANASATTVCNGASVTLTGSGASIYAWTNGVTNGVAFVPTATTTYTLTGTDNNDCISTATKTITVNSLPVVTANTSAAVICNGANVTLTGSGASTYTWTNGVTNGIAFTPNATKTYTVTGMDNNTCQNTATKTITVNSLPTVTANASSSAVCNGAGVTLTGSGANSYTWTNGVTNGVVFMPNTTKTYTVTGTDNNTCQNTATKTITVNMPPSVNAGSTVTILQGHSTVIGGIPTATGNAPPFTYSWTPTTGLDSAAIANPMASPADTIVYTVIVSDANGCTSSDSIRVVVDIPTGFAPATNGNLFLVFPNPTNDLLNITASKIENGEYRIELRDVIGQIIFSDKLDVSNHAAQKQFSLSGLTTGMYFLVIENKGRRSVMKVHRAN